MRLLFVDLLWGKGKVDDLSLTVLLPTLSSASVLGHKEEGNEKEDWLGVCLA